MDISVKNHKKVARSVLNFDSDILRAIANRTDEENICCTEHDISINDSIIKPLDIMDEPDIRSTKCVKTQKLKPYPKIDTCPICGKMFWYPDMFRIHMKKRHMQTKKKQHKCPSCNKKFLFIGNLDRHLISHNHQEEIFPSQRFEDSFTEIPNQLANMTSLSMLVAAEPKYNENSENNENQSNSIKQENSDINIRQNVFQNQNKHRELYEEEIKDTVNLEIDSIKKNIFKNEETSEKLNIMQENEKKLENNLKLEDGRKHIDYRDLSGTNSNIAFEVTYITNQEVQKEETSCRYVEFAKTNPLQFMPSEFCPQSTLCDENVMNSHKTRDICSKQNDVNKKVRDIGNVYEGTGWTKCFCYPRDLHKHKLYVDRNTQIREEKSDQTQKTDINSGKRYASDKDVGMENNIYKCSNCGKWFYHTWELKRHMRHHNKSHFGDKLMKFDFYLDKSQSRCTLETVNNYEDNDLPKGFSSNENLTQQKSSNCRLKKNRKASSNQKTHAIEDKGYPLRSNRTFSKENIYKCIRCLKVFSNAGNLKRHTFYHDNPSYPCKVCSKIFDTFDNMKKHKQCHNRQSSKKLCVYKGKKQYKCNGCSKLYFSYRNFSRHKKCHVSNNLHQTINNRAAENKQTKQFQCTKCLKTYFSQRSLDQHNKFDHIQREPFYECDYCPKTYHSLSGLHNHTRYHEDPTYACPICSKRFYRSNLMLNHVKQHEENKE